MNTPTSSPRPTLHQSWRLLVLLGAVYVVVILISVGMRADSTSDFRDFWENAVHLRETGEISTELGVHNYLPFFTIFMLPWGSLPLIVASVLFSALSLVLFGVTVVLTENLLNDGLPHKVRPALLIALLLALPYVHSCAVLGNVMLLVLFLVVTCWFLVERGREWEAGAALGLAVLIKLLPGALLVFFLLKRRWRVLTSSVAVIVVLGLGLPLAALGWQRTVKQHEEFWHGAIKQHSAYTTLTAEKPIKAMLSNNSLPIVLRRLMTPVDGQRGSDRPLLVNFANLSPPALVGLYGAMMALVLGTSGWVTLRGGQRWPPDSIAEGRRLRAQFGLWCLVALVCTPLLWTHYLPLAYWPLAFLADRADRSRRAHEPARLTIVALVLWGVGALLLAWPAARAAGAQLWSAVMLWLALMLIAWRVVATAPPPRAPRVVQPPEEDKDAPAG